MLCSFPWKQGNEHLLSAFLCQALWQLFDKYNRMVKWNLMLRHQGNNSFQFVQLAKEMSRNSYRVNYLPTLRIQKVKRYIFEEISLERLVLCVFSPALLRERGLRIPPPKPKSRKRNFEETSSRF